MFIYRKTFWTCPWSSEKYLQKEQTTHEFLNGYIHFQRHAPGVDFWALSISIKGRFWDWSNFQVLTWSKPNRWTIIDLRLGKYFLTFQNQKDEVHELVTITRRVVLI